MRRCIQLALLGSGRVAPNPLVGAVLVHEGRILGEGYHEQFGHDHAEVNCLRSVPHSLRSLIQSSTLYVSLEPCAHFGKTPPCADLIIRHQIPRVVIGCRDPFPEVDGKGLAKLLAAGTSVKSGIQEPECRELNRRFFTFQLRRRPYVILKWAQTGNGIIGNAGNDRLFITNEFTGRLVHKWRSEEAAVMVGTRTALLDDPQLTNRFWNGPDPIRITIDKLLQIPSSHHLLDQSRRTIVFNTLKHQEDEQVSYYQVTDDVSLVRQMLNALYDLGILSVMIEGGARLSQSFIDEGFWDEARIITNTSLTVSDGVRSPVLANAALIKSEFVGSDRIDYYRRAGATA